MGVLRFDEASCIEECIGVNNDLIKSVCKDKHVNYAVVRRYFSYCIHEGIPVELWYIRIDDYRYGHGLKFITANGLRRVCECLLPLLGVDFVSRGDGVLSPEDQRELLLSGEGRRRVFRG